MGWWELLSSPPFLSLQSASLDKSFFGVNCSGVFYWEPIYLQRSPSLQNKHWIKQLHLKNLLRATASWDADSCTKGKWRLIAGNIVLIIQSNLIIEETFHIIPLEWNCLCMCIHLCMYPFECVCYQQNYLWMTGLEGDTNDDATLFLGPGCPVAVGCTGVAD